MLLGKWLSTTLPGWLLYFTDHLDPGLDWQSRSNFALVNELSLRWSFRTTLQIARYAG